MRLRSAAEHKSRGTYPFRHALVGVRGDTRDLTVEGSVHEDGDLYAIRDAGAVVRLDLSPEGVEFLLTALPSDDGFTELLAYARDLARLKRWDRDSGAKP